MNVLYMLFGPLLGAFHKVKTSIDQAVKMKIESFYSNSINLIRVVFLNLFILILSLLFALVGFILLPISIVVFSPWPDPTKMLVGIIISVVYMLFGILMYLWMFEKKRWKKIFTNYNQ